MTFFFYFDLEPTSGLQRGGLYHPNPCLVISRLFQKSGWEMLRSIHFPGSFDYPVDYPLSLSGLARKPAWEETGKERRVETRVGR